MYRTGRILIVDDEAGVRDACQLFLSSAGHEVATAASAERALEMIAVAAYDVALVDVQMPGMGGVALIPYLREKNITTVIVSGMISNDVMLAHPFKCVHKPFTPAQLSLAVDEGIRHHDSKK